MNNKKLLSGKIRASLDDTNVNDVDVSSPRQGLVYHRNACLYHVTFRILKEFQGAKLRVGFALEGSKHECI